MSLVPDKDEFFVYAFGPFRLDAGQRLLLRDGEVVALPPKILSTLLVLVEHSGHILGKDDLIKILWPDTFVEDGSLTRNISYLRKALGEAEQQYIETIPKRGYRFIAPVKRMRANEIAPRSEVENASRTEAKAKFPTVEASLNGTALLLEQEIALPTNRMPTATSMPRKRVLITALLLIALVGVVSFFRFTTPAENSALTQARLQLTKLTNTGQARHPALSPNGKYVAQVLDNGRQQSLVVRQAANSSTLQIVPPADVRYQGLTFSPDNNYVYYVVYEEAQTIGILYQVPLLGGIARRIINDVDSPVTFSPDGRQLAFLRNYLKSNETSLIVANADGSGERRLATRIRPTPFMLTGPSWSPDGKQIACVAKTINARLASMDVLAVEVRDGTQTPLTTQLPNRRWITIGQVCWLRDGSGILAIAWREPTYTFSDQLWLLPTRAGEPRQLTNDSNSYSGISAAADACTFATTQFTRVSNIYVAPTSQIQHATPVASGVLGHANLHLGLAWTPDGKIVYSSTANGRSDLWLMNADGGNRQPLTDDPATDLQPAVSPNGQEIAFVSWRSGTRAIWQMQPGSGKQRLLVNNAEGISHSFSPDGQWIVYDSLDTGISKVWKRAVEGEAAVQLTDFYSYQPVVSPDGRWLACYYLAPSSSRVKLALVPFGATQVAKSPAKVFDHLPLQGPMLLRWMPDSQALIFSSAQHGISNLWRQPLDGCPAKPITNFTEDKIFSFAWSQDGKHLAYERGKVLSDTLLLTVR